MKDIDAGYQHLANTAVPAALNMTGARQALSAVQSNIEWLEISTTAAGKQSASTRLSVNRKNFDSYMEAAAADAPAQSSEIASVQARGDALVDNTCALAIQLGVAATSSTGLLAAQNEYLAHCQPAFLPTLDASAAEVTFWGRRPEQIA